VSERPNKHISESQYLRRFGYFEALKVLLRISGNIFIAVFWLISFAMLLEAKSLDRLYFKSA